MPARSPCTGTTASRQADRSPAWLHHIYSIYILIMSGFYSHSYFKHLVDRTQKEFTQEAALLQHCVLSVHPYPVSVR